MTRRRHRVDPLADCQRPSVTVQPDSITANLVNFQYYGWESSASRARWEADFLVYFLDHSPTPSKFSHFFLSIVIDERKRREEIFFTSLTPDIFNLHKSAVATSKWTRVDIYYIKFFLIKGYIKKSGFGFHHLTWFYLFKHAYKSSPYFYLFFASRYP